jgi:hypothetical protein
MFCHPCAGVQFNTFQHFIAEDRIPRSDHKVSDVFFGESFINMFINELESVFDNLYDDIFIRPLDKLFSDTRVLFSGATHNEDIVKFNRIACPGSGRTFEDALAASDTSPLIAFHLSFMHTQRPRNLVYAVLDACFAADAALVIVLWFNHPHNPEIVHACFNAVIGAPGEGDFNMVVIRIDFLLNPLRQRSGVIVGKRTHPAADTCGNVAGSGSLKFYGIRLISCLALSVSQIICQRL